LALFSKGSHQKPKKTRKFHFQIEDIGNIFQRFPSQAQNTTDIPFSNTRYWHCFPKVTVTSPEPRKYRFQTEDIDIFLERFLLQDPKKDGNPIFK